MTGEYRRSQRRMSRRREKASRRIQPTVAVMPWGHIIEDYLDDIGLSLDDFVEQMSGGWLFGYVDALKSAGIRPVLIVISAGVYRAQRRIQASTDVTMWLLPSPKVYRRLRLSNNDPYAFDWRAAAASRRGLGKVPTVLAWAVSPWVSTPMRSLRRVLHDEACDTLICQEYEEPRFDLCVALRRLLGVRVFATFQGGSHTRWFERPGRGWAMRSAAGLIVADEREVERVGTTHRIDQRRIVRIPNPLSLRPLPDPNMRLGARASLGVHPRAPVALWYGRVDRHAKGLDTLLDAWDIVSANWSEDPAPVLLLVGAGLDAEWLRERIAGTHGLIYWHDKFVLDRWILETRLAAADVFVQPSRHEGFAVAPMEAMAAAVPVIATDASGIRHLLGDNSGTITSEGALALAEAISRAFSDPEAARNLGERGRRRIESSFSTAAVGQALAAFLCEPDAPVD